MVGWMRDRWSIAVLAVGMLIAPIACGDSDDGGHRAAATATIATPAPATAPSSPSAVATISPQVSPPPSASGATATVSITAPVATASACDCTIPTATPAAPTPTAAPLGPQITYFGIAAADDAVLTPTEYDAAGRPVFAPPRGSGISIVLEARGGARALVRTAYDPTGGPRGLDMLVSRPLGNGSPRSEERRVG